MNKRLKALGIFIITFLILSIGLTVLSSLKPVEKDLQPLPQPTSFPNTSPTSTPKAKSISPIIFETNPSITPFTGDFLTIKKSLITKMPYQTDDFLIEYTYTSDSFIVTIKQSPFEQNVTKAENWIKSQGITDLGALDITYSSYRWVQ